jgi:hypothetical protein
MEQKTNMRNHHYIDFEFNGAGGKLISFSILRNDGDSMYLIFKDQGLLEFDDNDQLVKVSDEVDPWVKANVIPILFDCPVKPIVCTMQRARELLEGFLSVHWSPHIIADYPADLAYFCEQLLITGPGTCINVQHMTLEWMRYDVYPTLLPGAVQHNAWWDTQAMLYFLGHHQKQIDAERTANDPRPG